MKKKILMPICILLVLILLSGCGSKALTNAKSAYVGGDYQAVVDTLESVKKPTAEMQSLLKNARIHLAFDAGDYQQVLDLVGSETPADEEIAALLTEAQAAVSKQKHFEEIQAAFDAGDYEKVIELVSEEDAADEAVAVMLDEALAAEARALKPGRVVNFGTYKKEPLEWIVLEVKEDQVLLISKYALDEKLYQEHFLEATWENCDLRAWLNSDFVNAAFTEEEQRAVLTVSVDNSKAQGSEQWETDSGNDTEDQMFLLSYAECLKYFPTEESRICEDRTGKACRWWLRSPGENEFNVLYVDSAGDLKHVFVNNEFTTIRPAFWINPNAADLNPQP